MDKQLQDTVEKVSGQPIVSAVPVGGGCISDAYKITLSDGKKIFAKTARIHDDMFIIEKKGLDELSKGIKVPKAYYADEQCLVLEFIESRSRVSNFFTDFGRKFAQLHKHSADNFGLTYNNYIGSNIQQNIPSGNGAANWSEFYFTNRIEFQLYLAEQNGFSTSELRTKIKKLESKTDDILSPADEAPALLHGDLWNGNYMCDENGQVCLIDPAVYYGHREADLAMTKLFGGFPLEFYNAYNEAYPLLPDYEYREPIYKLYHILNHLNLFGTGYYQEAIHLIDYYL